MGETETQTENQTALDIPWNIVVWDDPVNLMSYVVYVLEKVFGYNRSLATKLMLEVHNQGKSLVATEEREQAELHLHQLHSYGLQATLRRADKRAQRCTKTTCSNYPKIPVSESRKRPPTPFPKDGTRPAEMKWHCLEKLETGKFRIWNFTPRDVRSAWPPAPHSVRSSTAAAPKPPAPA